MESSRADDWLEVLQSLGVSCLYHVTDKDNLPSILKERGLCSWRKLSDDEIPVPRPGGSSITHRLDARVGRDDAVHLYASKPSPAILRSMKDTGLFSELCVLTISLRAIRPAAATFWIGDPYVGGEKVESVRELSDRLETDPSLLSRLSVDIHGSVHLKHIGNVPDDVWTRISEVHPTAIVFVIDQSCSMEGGYSISSAFQEHNPNLLTYPYTPFPQVLIRKVSF